MLQGKCVDTGGSTNLTKGELYYLFPHGGHAYCASRFPRPGSHFGAYQKNHFELVDVAIDAPAQVLNKYLARVVKPPSHFYQIDEEYIITEPRADGYYSVFFKHRPDDPPIGAYKRNDCFERIVSLEESAKDTATIFEVGDIVEIIDASIIERKHYENGVQATVIENFYGCISIQRNELVNRMVVGSVLLVGEELQTVKKVGSRPVLEAVMVNDKQEKVNQTTKIECEISEIVKLPVKKQKYEQLSLF
ncbi:hypothetical protein NY607_09200 [Lysinibacillus sp. A4]|uniref:hypothetical protein n=1 Tax=Lysinibacillus sp. A4 TaxID=2976269 RepID=UPI002175E37F|nr:hypothetical protein [Lysinibacillus sp. A4]MCS5501293.1 hypothetical protein [Lysinibacillus sp. A4]